MTDAPAGAEASPSTPVAHPSGVRTFTPRFRLSDLTRERMATLMPAREVPEGTLCRAALGDPNQVVIEIGSGHGAAALAYAGEHPDSAVVALEVHVPGVARMLAAARDQGIDNVYAHVGDALVFLAERVEPASVDRIHVFFPDPWPKARHAKRRIIQPHTLELFGSRLAPGGRLLIATDIADYAEHIDAVLAADPRWEVARGRRPDWRPYNGFEAKGIAAGRAVAEFSARRTWAHGSG